MKKQLAYYLGLLTLCFTSFTSNGQAYVTIDIEEEYEFLTTQWLKVSDDLSHYAGLSEFCVNQDYRTYTLEILELLHHYDSVVLDILKKPHSDIDISSREYHKTMKDIEKFEEGHDVKGFISFLRESCTTRNELEQDKEDLRKEVGMYSYDGQIMMLETDLNKFMKKIDRRIVAINEHVHKIHPSQVKALPMVSNE